MITKLIGFSYSLDVQPNVTVSYKSYLISIPMFPYPTHPNNYQDSPAMA